MSKFLGFPKQLITAILCQQDNFPLSLANEQTGKFVFNGCLICRHCRTVYQVKSGILHLLSQQNPLSHDMQTEIKSRDIEVGEYNRKFALRYYHEVPPTLKEFGNEPIGTLVEYGCGSGRFTLELSAKCRLILAVDFSLNSLFYLAKNLRSANVGLVLADATQVKTGIAYFNAALAAQFFEHIPLWKQKEAFLKNVGQTLKPGAIFVCSVYHQDLYRRLYRQPATGYHKNGIYFHYFTKPELHREFSPRFKIVKLKWLDITLPFMRRMSMPLPWQGKLSRFLEKIPILNRFGHLLLIKCRKQYVNEAGNSKG